MKKAWWLVALTGLVGAAAVALVVLLVVKALWAWTVPDLFPGAVKVGLVARDISWLAAFKVSLFAAVIAGIAGARKAGRG
jgi:hypothetical protein